MVEYDFITGKVRLESVGFDIDLPEGGSIRSDGVLGEYFDIHLFSMAKWCNEDRALSLRIMSRSVRLEEIGWYCAERHDEKKIRWVTFARDQRQRAKDMYCLAQAEGTVLVRSGNLSSLERALDANGFTISLDDLRNEELVEACALYAAARLGFDLAKIKYDGNRGPLAPLRDRFVRSRG